MEELFEKLKDYADTRINLFRLKSINKASGLMSSVITMVILSVFFFLVLLCITIGAAILIGEWTGKVYCGFFIVAGIYLIIGLVFYFMRDKWLRAPVSNKLIKEIID